jgi:hypothetical protein
MSARPSFWTTLGVWVLLALGGCGGGTEAQRRGVGAECTKDSDCVETGQRCLTNFKGGYCGISPCTSDMGCPSGSACVTHDDGTNYCFLICTDKPQCNGSRSLANEANCASSPVLVDTPKDRKVCVPPSGN